MSAQAKKIVENTVILVLSSIGMGCLLCGLFCAFLTPSTLFISPAGDVPEMIVRLALVVGLMSVSIFSAVSHGSVFALCSFSWFNCISLACILLSVLVSFIAMGTLLPGFIFIVSAFLAGWGYGFCFVSWADTLRPFWHYQVGVYVALSYFVASILALFVNHMDRPFALAAYGAAVCVAVVLLRISRQYMELEEDISPANRERFPLSPWHEVLIGYYSMICGVFLVLFFQMTPTVEMLQWLAVSVVAAASVYAVTLMVRKKYFPSGLAQRIVCIPLLAALVIVPLVDEATRWVVCLVIIASFFYLDIANYSSLIALSDEQNTSPFFIISRGRLFLYGGLASGVLLGYALFAFGLASDENSLIAVFFALALVLLVMALMKPFEVNYVSDRMRFEDAEEDIDRLDAHCLLLAERFGLTARELDVLLLLARGRNAKFIEQELYISLNTAKTHIGHIYRKLDINSQQALLDMVDEVADR